MVPTHVSRCGVTLFWESWESFLKYLPFVPFLPCPKLSGKLSSFERQGSFEKSFLP